MRAWMELASDTVSARAWSRKSDSAVVKSMIPSTVLPSLSKMGAAAHDHRCRPSQKCSAAKTWTGCRLVSAVPMPLVPAMASPQWDPCTMPESAAARSWTSGAPVMCSMHPDASARSITPGTSSRNRPTSWMIGIDVSRNSWLASARCLNSSSLRRRARAMVTSTPMALQRRHSSTSRS